MSAGGDIAKQLGAIAAQMQEPETLAALFCELDDDAQAQFFVHVARLMDEWGPGKRAMQLRFIGDHMRTCSCSTQEARDLVCELAEIIQEQP